MSRLDARLSRLETRLGGAPPPVPTADERAQAREQAAALQRVLASHGLEHVLSEVLAKLGAGLDRPFTRLEFICGLRDALAEYPTGKADVGRVLGFEKVQPGEKMP
jgi:hypothetical protein